MEMDPLLHLYSIVKEQQFHISIGGSALVGAPGFEPGTSALSGLRSSQLSYAPAAWAGPLGLCWPTPYGGDDRDRTDNLSRARAALSQLSYVPRRRGARGLRLGVDPSVRLCHCETRHHLDAGCGSNPEPRMRPGGAAVCFVPARSNRIRRGGPERPPRRAVD